MTVIFLDSLKDIFIDRSLIFLLKWYFLLYFKCLKCAHSVFWFTMYMFVEK